jgi:hypothetical protein
LEKKQQETAANRRSLEAQKPQPKGSKVFCFVFRNCPGMEIASTEGQAAKKAVLF